MRILLGSAAASVPRLPRHLAGLAEVLTGHRVFEYLSGRPIPDWVRWWYPAFYLMPAGLLIAMFRWGSPMDRRLVGMCVVVVGLVLVAGQTLRLEEASYERYILYLVPFAGLVVVRGVAAVGKRFGGGRLQVVPVVCIGLSVLCLMQFWFGYFVPLRDQRYTAQLHRTFQTGAVEPKEAAARLIRSRLDALGGAPPIYAEDWWVRHPLQYLLGGSAEVKEGLRPADLSGSFVVVGFTNSSFMRESIAATEGHTGREIVAIGHNGRSTILTVVILKTP
jgi:hypothetical protein